MSKRHSFRLSSLIPFASFQKVSLWVLVLGSREESDKAKSMERTKEETQTMIAIKAKTQIGTLPVPLRRETM